MLSYGLEEKAIIVAFCDLQKFLWLLKNARTPKYSYLQALLEKHAIDTWQIVKLSECGPNRRIHGTLCTLPKHPPSVDSAI